MMPTRFEPPTGKLTVDRTQADSHAATRGTVQHEILEGKKADVFVDGDALEIRVSCRAAAGSLEERVPYALAVTLEVAEGIGVPIYDEIASAFGRPSGSGRAGRRPRAVHGREHGHLRRRLRPRRGARS